MKTNKLFWIGLLLIAGMSQAAAQQVSTLYFLENAPMRHTVNPAFQPVSDGYVNFTPLGYTSLWLGNNSLTMSDAIMNVNGQTVTALHPNVDRATALKPLRKVTLTDGDITLDLLSFGFRHKEKGYVHIGIMERIDGGIGLPKDLFSFVLDGGMKNLSGVNNLNIKNTMAMATAYTEISGGYSYKINDQWTVGGKIKFLLGQVGTNIKFSNMDLDASYQQWHLYGQGVLQAAAPINLGLLPDQINYETLKNFNYNQMTNGLTWKDYLKPQGYGAGIDMGFTYKPHPQVQITAAVNDLGFVVWKGVNYALATDTSFVGGNFKYSDYANGENNYQFDGNKFFQDLASSLEGLAKGLHSTKKTNQFTRMLQAKLNVGVDANFCDNILGVGVVSKTRLVNGRLYEEVTLGGAVRPCNWFNFAVSYSLVNNGKYSNIGAGLSFMPYDGINLTLAMDYIPTSYVKYNGVSVPYKDKGMNVALGFSIVWGTNKRDSDKDGVINKLDLCPNTPRGVQVDEHGCPVDSDGDGVPDYLDKCPETPAAAIGYVDSLGCPIDSDNDGVPDYKDQCPHTLPEAVAFVDSVGCDKDSDGDGVPDYLDKCPDTPAEAYGLVDSTGCPIDTDGDGVPDYLDQCPNTPQEAFGKIDSVGCPIDSDKDGVPDYKDQCPNTLPEAVNFVDSVGCDKDTDGDGIPDYLDACPTMAGPKENNGCPVIKKEIRTLLEKAMQGIQFESGKAVIKKSSFTMLNQIAKTFIENPSYVIEVQGHTDNTGNYDMNMKLSQDRADAVKAYLVKAGVEESRLTAVGYGPNRPIADNATKQGRTQNRRVEFIINFEQVSYETIMDRAK